MKAKDDQQIKHPLTQWLVREIAEHSSSCSRK